MGPEPGAGQLYREFAPAVLGYFRSQRAFDPEDLLGEVFYQVARDRHRFRGPDDALRRWVFTIAHHRLVDDRRRRAARPQVADGPLLDLAAAPIGPTDLDADLMGALATLTESQREVVVLRFVADLAVRDVARITRRRSGAVKALQARALAHLAQRLAPTDG